MQIFKNRSNLDCKISKSRKLTIFIILITLLITTIFLVISGIKLMLPRIKFINKTRCSDTHQKKNKQTYFAWMDVCSVYSLEKTTQFWFNLSENSQIS